MICALKAKKHGFVSLPVPPCPSLSLSHFLQEESPRANGQGRAVSAGSRQGWGNGWKSTGFWGGGEDKDGGSGPGHPAGGEVSGTLGQGWGRKGRAPPSSCTPPAVSPLPKCASGTFGGDAAPSGDWRGTAAGAWGEAGSTTLSQRSQQHGPSGLRTRTSPAQTEPGLPSVQPPDAPRCLWPELAQGGAEAGAGRWALPGACGCSPPLPPSPPPGLPDLLRLRVLQGSGPRRRLRPQPLGPRGR